MPVLLDTNIVGKLANRERLLTEDIKQTDTSIGSAEQRIAFSPARATADQREKELRVDVSAWLVNVGSLKGHAEVARSKRYRHTILAHSAVVDPMKPTKVKPMRYVDPQRVLQKTIPIVSEGFRLATGKYYDFATTVAVWRDRQFDMWEIVRCAARGEQFAPAPRTIADLAREFPERGSVTIRGC